jgi:hypothetical protein
MCGQYSRNRVTDVGCGAKHKRYLNLMNHDIFQCDAIQTQYSAKASLRAQYSAIASLRAHLSIIPIVSKAN